MNRRAIILTITLTGLNLAFVSATMASLNNFATRPNQDVPQTTLNTREDTAVYQFSKNQPQANGGGEWLAPEDHISAEQRQQIETALAINSQQLQEEGKLLVGESPETVSFTWPVRPADSLHDFGYHGIANFVDHNPSYPNFLLDYACGERTYDTYSGYNHPGTDIFTWPFPWNRMDNDEIMAVAAAAGVIVFRQDGNYDRNCSFTGNPWNAIYVQHSDGTIAWYGHLKNGSLTPKQVGQWVEAGEYLGIVGSSGSSTGPHLHFELQAANGLTLDPYAGVCNPATPDSLWQAQPDYYDTAVNKITTGDAPPFISQCSTPEQSHEATTFNPGDTIYFTTYYRDQLGSQPSQYTIYRPDGSVFQGWQHHIPDPHYAASWWWWSFDMPTDELQGYWEFEVVLNNLTYTHTFLIGTPPPPTPTPMPTPEPTPEPPAVITVTAPNGGEVITPGTFLSITWQTGLTAVMEVDLLHNEQVSRTLGLSGDGRITWTIPLSTGTAIYSIRVSNTLSPTQYDESDNSFVIGILDHYTHLPIVIKPEP